MTEVYGIASGTVGIVIGIGKEPIKALGMHLGATRESNGFLGRVGIADDARPDGKDGGGGSGAFEQEVATFGDKAGHGGCEDNEFLLL